MADYTGSFSGSFTGSLLSTNGVISSSAQVIGSLPSGVISGSSQIDAGALTIDYFNLQNLPVTITPFQANSILANSAARDNFAANVVTQLNNNNVISSSAQVSASAAASGFGTVPEGTVSSSAQISALGYITSQTDAQTLSISGQTLTISNGNSVVLPQAGVGSGASIWNTGSQDPASYTALLTQNNLQVTGSFDVLGDFTVNGQSVFIQTSASDAGAAVVVEGRLKILEEQIGAYIASASIQIGNSQDSIDCGGFF